MGELDVLFIDLPPGTGDEPLSIAQLLPEIDGVIIVTMPSELSKAVVEKAITFARRLGMPIIGVVENMSGFTCPHCGTKIDIFQSGGGKELAQQTQVPFSRQYPHRPRNRQRFRQRHTFHNPTSRLTSHQSLHWHRQERRSLPQTTGERQDSPENNVETEVANQKTATIKIF